jgi:glycosyltransferase involved in cell wall biosynthesis
LKLAIVIPWFGRELKGGAEQLAWQLAMRLTKRGHAVDVLTTCCRSHQDDWATNHFPAGAVEEPEGFMVRRFPVDPRNRPAFDRVCATLLAIPPASLRRGVSPVDEADAWVFVNELIKSESLVDFVRSQVARYRRVILLPYLYGPVINCAMLLAERALLQPCLHDEAYAYLSQISDAFDKVGALAFNSEGEQELALRLFGPGIWRKSRVVGSGIERSDTPSPSTGAIPRPIEQPFVLYLGRKDPGKNVPLLLSAFARFKQVRPNSQLKLVLAGHGELEHNGSASVIDCGVVSDAEKEALLHNCVALLQPSTNESFSRVMMEAWRFHRPVGVHARCLATASAVRTSGGGWIADTEGEWAELFTIIDRSPAAKLAEIGQRGADYSKETADWDNVMRRYEEALEARPAVTVSVTAPPRARGEVHQVLPNLAFGDAISNHAMFIRDVLRAEGYRSDIYVRHADPRINHECYRFFDRTVSPEAGIIYHHSIGTELTPGVLAHRGRKFLLYHNITPDHFFAPYRPEFAQILRNGRDRLADLARHFPASAGVSEFNRAELEQHGFANPTILPLPVDPDRWHVRADPGIMATLQDGRTNILFVGRVAPNKKQEDLIDVFELYLALDPSARLILAGLLEQDDPYACYVRGLISSIGLGDSVLLTDSVTDVQLAAYYSCADLFWSMSEHEGFCVPLIEAMWFDVPVLAYKSTAVPETLGEAGLMFTSKDSLETVAALAHRVVSERKIADAVINAQRQRRLAFLPERVQPLVLNIAAQLTGAAV